MEIRAYEGKDSVGVKNLILSVLEKEYPFDKTAYKDTDMNDVTGTYSGEGNAFFVAETGGSIVGIVGVKKERDETALLRRLFVDERYREKGIGTSLLKKATDFCRSKSYEEMIFRTTDRMSQAMDLCRKAGFKEKDDLEVSGFHIHKFTLKL